MLLSYPKYSSRLDLEYLVRPEVVSSQNAGVKGSGVNADPLTFADSFTVEVWCVPVDNTGDAGDVEVVSG
jgi:hypothetical protein